MNGFGKRIKELREKRGLTPDQVAEHTGFTKSVIWSYEMEKKEPRVSHIIRIAEYFNVSVDYILHGHHLPYEINLEQESDMEKHTITVDQKQLSKEELVDAIAFIKAKRLLKESEQ